jgi:hypothetical protein
MKHPVRPLTAGSAHIAGAWVFLIGAMIAGIFGVYRMMSPVAGTDAANAGLLAQGACCMSLGVLLGIIAAVLALLGIHKQASVAYAIGPTYQGSHGSDDNP